MVDRIVVVVVVLALALQLLGYVLFPTVKIGDAGLSTQVPKYTFEDLIFGQVSK